MRSPDKIIGTPEEPYLLRWHIIPRNRFFNIYLHKFLKSDDDRALHDHPWWSLSIALRGTAWEERSDILYPRFITQGDVIFRRALYRHRMIIEEPFWTLFITGPVIREWGFWCDGERFVPWREFVDEQDSGQVGRGCD